MSDKYDPASDHEPLFDLTPAEATANTGVERQRAPKSVAFAACPDCMAERVGLVPSGLHLTYRPHYRTTYGARRLMCRASYAAICEHPPRQGEPADDSPPSCRHLPEGIRAAVAARVEGLLGELDRRERGES